jgi:hypothetical protein
LRIVLQFANDRWEHALGWNDAGAFQPFARSVEGRPDDLWPASPALQELHIEERDDGRVAFLTGMAGSSHWSASIACDPAQHRATFDIACRSKQPPAWLGSLYQIPELVSVQHNKSLAELKRPPSESRLLVSTTDLIGAVPQFPQDQDNSWTCAFTESVKTLQRTLFISPETIGAGTLRWQYSVTLSDP